MFNRMLRPSRRQYHAQISQTEEHDGGGDLNSPTNQAAGGQEPSKNASSWHFWSNGASSWAGLGHFWWSELQLASIIILECVFEAFWVSFWRAKKTILRGRGCKNTHFPKNASKLDLLVQCGSLWGSSWIGFGQCWWSALYLAFILFWNAVLKHFGILFEGPKRRFCVGGVAKTHFFLRVFQTAFFCPMGVALGFILDRFWKNLVVRIETCIHHLLECVFEGFWDPFWRTNKVILRGRVAKTSLSLTCIRASIWDAFLDPKWSSNRHSKASKSVLKSCWNFIYIFVDFSCFLLDFGVEKWAVDGIGGAPPGARGNCIFLQKVQFYDGFLHISQKRLKMPPGKSQFHWLSSLLLRKQMQIRVAN